MPLKFHRTPDPKRIVSNFLVPRSASEDILLGAKDQVVKICALQETDLHRWTNNKAALEASHHSL